MVAAVLVLDLSFYLAHVAMHKVPFLWRFHRIHHSDLALDVTSGIRQHPGEGLYRYAALAATALLFGVGPAEFAMYRVASVLNGLLEHANIRVPRRVDALLSLVTTWPGVHRVHHSRIVEETDSNYGNILSWWDRMFGTFVPAHRGDGVVYGLDGVDSAHAQSTSGLLAMPFGAPRADAGRPSDVLPPVGPLRSRVALSAALPPYSGRKSGVSGCICGCSGRRGGPRPSTHRW